MGTKLLSNINEEEKYMLQKQNRRFSIVLDIKVK